MAYQAVNPANAAAGSAILASDHEKVFENSRFYLPTGALVPYAGSAAPTEFLLCDGSAVSRSTYADLFAVCGTTYGAGNGSTTFNLPDLRGRMPLGAGTGAGLNTSGTGAPSGTAQTARTRGEWGGEETHLNTSAESGVPAHNHGPGEGTAFMTTSGGANVSSGSGIAAAQFTPGTTANNVAANAASRHNTMPPFVVTNYLIKT